MAHCLFYPDVELTRDNSPAAHIIPSALGGRLAPTMLLCHDANETLNRKVDNPLVRALSPIMTMLGAHPDRGGGVRPADVVGADTGTRYVFSFDSPITLKAPSYEETQHPGGVVQADIRARTMKEARTLLGRVQKQVPGFNIEAALAGAKEQSFPVPEAVRFSLNLGSGVCFAAAYTMLALFAAHRIGFCPPAWRPYIATLDPTAPTLPSGVFHFYADAPWIEGGDGMTGHKLALFTGEGGELCGYAELFGAISVGAVLAPDFGREVEELYACDILERRDVEGLRIDRTALRRLGFRANPEETGQAPDQILPRLHQVVALAAKRQREAAIGRIVAEVFGQLPEGAEVTEETLNLIAYRVAHEVAAPMLAAPGLLARHAPAGRSEEP